MTEHMDIGGRSRLVWPCILAASFFFIPIILLFAYPISFWCSTDNEPVGLANALNMAYRLADLRLYPAEGMTNHPGVQFYFMSWLALAFTGYPVAGAGQEFFQAVIDHADDYFRPMIYVAALVGAAGVYLFARTALKLIPIDQFLFRSRSTSEYASEKGLLSRSTRMTLCPVGSVGSSWVE